VSTRFNNPTFIEHHDPVCSLDCGQSVRNDQDGLVLRHGFDRIENAFLALCVKMRCRLVEDQERTVSQNSPRDCDTLALAP
jgi:hypothetical protein